MALVKCRECRHEVSNDSLKCPNCGAWFPGLISIQKKFLILSIGLLLFLISVIVVCEM